MSYSKSARKFCETSQNTTLYLLFQLLAVELLLHCFSVAVAVPMETEKENLGFNSPPIIQLTFSFFEGGTEELVYAEHPILLARSYERLRILCIAPYPIEWKWSSLYLNSHDIISYRSPANPKFLNPKAEEHDEDEKIPIKSNHNPLENDKIMKVKNATLGLRIFNPHEFFYHLEFKFYAANGIFGYMGSCQNIRQGNGNKPAGMEKHGNLLEQKLDVFQPSHSGHSKVKYLFEAESRFKILNRRRMTAVKGNRTINGFLIPCPLINASMAMEEPQALNMTLIQVFHGGQENETRLESVDSDYDPNAGFFLEGSEAPIQGIFVCLAQLRAGKGTGSRFENQSENVTFEFVKTGWEHRNQEQEDWLDVTHDETRDFPRRKFNDTKTTIEIYPSTGQAQCSSNSTAVQTQLSWLRCDTHTKCDAYQKCFFRPCWPYTVLEAGIDNYGRKTLPLGSLTGVFGCTGDGDQVYATSFTGFNRIKYYTNTNIDRVPPHSALIQFLMETKSEGHPVELYTNEPHSFECKALKFLFLPKLVVLARYANGEKAYFPAGSISTKFRDTPGTIVTHVSVNLTSTMTGIVCLASWFNSTEWLEANISFTAKDLSRPKISKQKPGEKQQVFYVDEIQRYLSCEAEGEPKPTFKWTKKSSATGPETEIQDILNSVKFLEGGTVLQFPKITKNDSGIYFCEARNKFGTDSKGFVINVKVKVKEIGLSTGGIIGVVVGAIIIFLAFAFILWKYLQTHRKLRNLSADEIDEFLYGNPDAMKNAEVQGENAHLLPFNKEYEVPDSEFKIDREKLLGSGEFGVVYGGKFRESEVAIKTIKSTANVDFFKAFLKEIKVMTLLGRHPNVVQLLGTSTKKIRKRIVFVLVELGVHGSLNSFLMKHKQSFVDTLTSSQLFNIAPEQLISKRYENIESTIKMTTMDLVKWCGQIAAGMSHLASKKIIHGDLAARNILLFDDYTAKITDFGLSRQLYSDVYSKKGKSPLPWRSLAPESLKYLQFSVKSDVWSFGVLAWEIFSLAALPYPGVAWTPEFLDNLEQGQRLQKPKLATTQIYENMCDCWNLEPEYRLDFEQIEKFYNDILSLLLRKTIQHEGREAERMKLFTT